MPSVIGNFEDWAHDRREQFGHLVHHQPAQTAQEADMTRIADARAAIAHADQQLAQLAANPLAEAILEAGVGTGFPSVDIGLVLAMVRAIEHGPGMAATATEQDRAPVQPQPIS